MNNKHLKKIVLSAMFIAIGFVLPFFTGQIQQIGNMLLPMHIPVMLCGLLCGWQYGLAVGFILPLMRSLILSMPVMYPSAIAMAFELATYGLLNGLIFYRAENKSIRHLYFSLIISMLCGRIIWGLSQVTLLGLSGNGYTISAFITSAFANAVPGIVLQLIFIPSLLLIMKKTYTKKSFGYTKG